MLKIIVDVLIDSFKDVIKMIPIMFLMIFLSDILVSKINMVKAHDSLYGVFTGALLGIIPQCGIPVGFAELYGKSMIGISVLLAVFLSSSDEAIIIAAGHYNIYFIISLIFTKVLVAVIFGVILHFIFKDKQSKVMDEKYVNVSCKKDSKIGDLLIKSLKSTISISIYVFIAAFLINLTIELIGLERLNEFLINTKYIGPVITSFIGLIPSCASSIFLMEAYMDNIIGYGALISGLCANSGYGILVIFKTMPLKNAIRLTLTLVSISIVAGEIILFIMG